MRAAAKSLFPDATKFSDLDSSQLADIYAHVALTVDTDTVVEVVDGATCGAPGFVRISYAVPVAVLAEALLRLRAGLLAE